MPCEECKLRKELRKAGIPEFVDVNELGDYLNLSPRRIQQIANEGWIPKSVNGKYRLYDCISGYVNYLKDQIVAKFEGRHENK